jgi:hypothetical protein
MGPCAGLDGEFGDIGLTTGQKLGIGAGVVVVLIVASWYVTYKVVEKGATILKEA